jgi:hypothetical protein
MFVFEFRNVLLAWLILAEEEHRRFGKGPAQMGVANLLAGGTQPFASRFFGALH